MTDETTNADPIDPNAMASVARDPSLAPMTDRRRPPRNRAAWRQRLVEAERGLTAGFRSDSVFFVHLFVGCLSVAAGFVFRLTATQWSILVLSFTMTIAAELFRQVLKQLGDLLAETAPRPAAKLTRLATAAVAVVTIGTAVSAAIVFGSRAMALFGGRG